MKMDNLDGGLLGFWPQKNIYMGQKFPFNMFLQK